MRYKGAIVGVLSAALVTASMAFSPNINAISSIETIKGSDRVRTSIESAERLKSDIVVFANGYSFADSLSSFNMCSRLNARLILVSKNTSVKDVLTKEYKKAYIIGGPSMISEAFENELAKKVENVERISGSDRYETNDKTLALAGFTSVGVCDGRNYPDALSSFGLLKDEDLGLKLVNGAKPYKADRRVTYTFGGNNSVIQDGGVRIAGADRYKTSEAVNERLDDVENVAVLTGKGFADALSSVNLVNSNPKTAVLLTDKKLSKSQKEFMKDVDGKVFVVGGMVTDEVVNELKAIESTEDKDSDKKDDKDDKDKNKDKDKINADNKLNEETYKDEKLSQDDPANDASFTIFDKAVIKMLETMKVTELTTKKSYLHGSGIGAKIDLNKNVAMLLSMNGLNVEVQEGTYSKENGEVIKYVYKLTPKHTHIETGRETITKADFERLDNQIDDMIERSGADRKTTAYDKVKAFSLYLVNNFTYDIDAYEDSLNPGSSKSALGLSSNIFKFYDRGKGTCEAFSKIAQRAFNFMGIKAYVSSGLLPSEYTTIPSQASHMTVRAYFDGAWHTIDVTSHKRKLSDRDRTDFSAILDIYPLADDGSSLQKEYESHMKRYMTRDLSFEAYTLKHNINFVGR